MKVLITPEANAYIYSHIEEPGTLHMIGQAMQFTQTREYCEGIAVARIDPNVKPVTYKRNRELGLRHIVADEKLLIFIPPKEERDMTEAFFEQQLSISIPFDFA